MCALIEENATAFGINDEEVEIVAAEASEYLRRHTKKGLTPFDISFFDPPYESAAYSLVNLISDTGGQLLTEGAVLIVEHHKKKDLPESLDCLKRYRTLKQGDSVLSFYRVVSSQ
jgi:16S rRNA G966 N2-methylase RsmD